MTVKPTPVTTSKSRSKRTAVSEKADPQSTLFIGEDKKIPSTKRTLCLPERIDKSLRLFAAENRISVSLIVAQAVEKFLLDQQANTEI